MKLPLKTDNRTNGGRFEQEFAEFLDKHGFWCHVLQQNKSGQPADIIAVKENYHCLIDCKEVRTNKGFVLSRAEENQRLAMQKFQTRGQNVGWFAVKYPGIGIRMLSLQTLLMAEELGVKAVTEVPAGQLMSAEEWVDEIDKIIRLDDQGEDTLC